MPKIKIPQEVKEKANQVIDNFNKSSFQKGENIAYYAEYRNDFLYLNRIEYGEKCPIARLRYSGQFDNWEFAIFKWSSERYDPDEWFFPGANHLNGTIEGAMKAGLEAYPIDY